MLASTNACQTKGPRYVKSKKIKYIYHVNMTFFLKWLPVLILDKVDFTAKNKGSIHQEDIAILKVYVPQNSFNIHEIKTDRAVRRIAKSTFIVGDLVYISL